MLNHISFGVADLARSRKFYDAVLKPLGLACTAPGDTSLGYGDAAGAIALWLLAAKKPVRAEAQNGLHVCFDAPSRKAVDAFHAAALKAGGSDNGRPGLRADYGAHYYAAFVIDPDGYRLEAFCGAAK
ncbi:VOC family protein [Ferrovibrio xuzhouensis]|uniref:VOC family protein n=1 Tax=Ferrovibrio xuzhouensis TaxID=1576914 RepID=A0ABV7VLP3_9PROT